jgi:ankyrin repeat protein
MKPEPLPFDAPLAHYEQQAESLLAAFRAGDPEAVSCFQHRLPRFLRSDVPWLPNGLSDAAVAATPLDVNDARMALARRYSFRDWAALAEHVGPVTQKGSPVHRFEAAVDAVVAGDLPTLERWLRADPELVRARSRRVMHFDPPVHGATLLHYVAANGVEGYRQRTPANAVEVAKMLLNAGAEVDALANLYGGQCTTMSLLVSSCHPAKAGVQVALAETLLDYGASVEGVGKGRWVSPLMTALVFGYEDAAEALVRRGAPVNDLVLAAGLGRLDDARRMLPAADPESRHRALALGALLGRTETVRLLLDAGEDPNRNNPEGMHSGATPLHHAAFHGHRQVVELLVDRGARLELKDSTYRNTPLGWAENAGQREIADFLRAQMAETPTKAPHAIPIRVVLPYHLRNLARVAEEVSLDVPEPVTIAATLDALEARFPMLRGTIRDHGTLKRRPFIRYFACKEDLSLEPTDTLLPAAVVAGTEPFLVVGAMAGG